MLPYNFTRYFSICYKNTLGAHFVKPQEVETIKYDFKTVLKPLCNIILSSADIIKTFRKVHISA